MICRLCVNARFDCSSIYELALRYGDIYTWLAKDCLPQHGDSL
jgi:hypothetical protein